MIENRKKIGEKTVGKSRQKEKILRGRNQKEGKRKERKRQTELRLEGKRLKKQET